MNGETRIPGAQTKCQASSTRAILLTGCTSRPLVSYLKALGILRVLAEQSDPGVRARWTPDGYYELQTCLDPQELETFFLTDYRPTPLVSPWNKDAGFVVQIQQGAVTVTADPSRLGAFLQPNVAPRFDRIREAVRCSCRLLEELVERGLVAVDDKGRPNLSGKHQDAKSLFATALRNELDEQVVALMDALVVLTSEGFNFGASPFWSGGNDGRLEFSSVYARLLVGAGRKKVGLFDLATGAARPGAAESLRGALYGANAPALAHDTTGLFNPLGTGGPNAEPGFRNAKPMANPWDFVFAVEGAPLLAGAATRRYRVGGGRVAVPFRVEVTPAGHSALSDRELKKVRAEVWLPLWSRWASYGELRTLFGEGRVQVGRRQAETGVDFIRALACLGVDRGFDCFERYAVMTRNGDSNLAVPLGTFRRLFNPHTRLLDSLDDWLRRVDRAARDGTASLRAAWRRFMDWTFIWCQTPEGASRPVVGAVLRSLGELERAVVPRRSTDRRNGTPQIGPLPRLEPRRWLRACEEDSPEFRIAHGVASLVARRRDGTRVDATRCHLEPIAWFRGGPQWEADSTDCVWEEGNLEGSLISVLQRRLFLASRWHSADRSPRVEPCAVVPTIEGERAAGAARLDDIVLFIERSVDERALQEWIWGLALLDWPRKLRVWTEVSGGREGASTEKQGEEDTGDRGAEGQKQLDWDQVMERARPRVAPLSPFYALLRLCLSGGLLRDRLGRPIPPDPQLVRLAVAGRALEASRRAVRRLRAAGYVPRVHQVTCAPDVARRVAAALLIPVRADALGVLADFVLGEVPWRAAVAQVG